MRPLAKRKLKQGLGFVLGFGLALWGLVPRAWAVPKSSAGPESLRQLASCPQVELQFSFGVDLSRGFVVNDPERPAAEVSAARAALKESPENAAEWLRLGTWLPSVGDTNGASSALNRAIRLLRSRVERHAADDEAQADLAEALKQSGRAEEAERSLRAAVDSQPKAWRCRVGLAQLLSVRWMSAAHPSGNRLPGDAAALSEKTTLQAEAGRLVERAVELAPEEPLAYRARGLQRFLMAQEAAMESTKRLGTAAAPGRDSSGRGLSEDPAAQAARAARDDYWKVATLWRTNVMSWGMASFTELVSQSGAQAADGVEFAALPADSQQRLINALHALDSVATSEPNSALALEMRGIIQFLTGSRAAAESTLKRAVRLDPGRFQAWEVLLALAIRSEDRDGLREICESRVRVRPGSRNQLLFAKSLERSGRFAEALEAAQEGGAREPADLWLQSAIVSLRLRTSTDAASLEGIPARLKEISGKLDRMPRSSEWGALIRHFVPTLCLYHALSGNTDEARRILTEWLKSNPSDSWSKEILEALGT